MKKDEEHKVLGFHYIWDIRNCPSERISFLKDIRGFIDDLSTTLELHVLGEVKNQFAPHGATLVLLLEESHLSIHTWPEENYMAVDLFSCVQVKNIEHFNSTLAKHFGKDLNVHLTYVERGT